MISWKTKNENLVEIEITTRFELNEQGIEKTSGLMEVVIDTRVDGESLGGIADLELIDHPEAVAKISNGTKAVGLSTLVFEAYCTELAKAERRIEENNKALDAHESKLQAIDDKRIEIENVA